MNFGKRLRILRFLKHINQKQLCKHLYITQSTYSNWENNRKMPKPDKVAVLAAFYSVSIDFLLYAEKIDRRQRQFEFIISCYSFI